MTLTGQLIDTGSWAGVGIRSPRHWLTVYAGLSPARAREIVRLANRRDQLPETVQAMADGRLSLDQAAVIAAYVPGSHSADATEFATLATVPQLRRSLSRYAFTEPEPEPEPEPGAAADGMPDTGPDSWSESARLSMGTQDGRFHLRFSAPASIGALLERAIREAKDALFTAGQTDATLADGLIEMANRSLSTVAGTARADKYRVSTCTWTPAAGGSAPAAGYQPTNWTGSCATG